MFWKRKATPDPLLASRIAALDGEVQMLRRSLDDLDARFAKWIRRERAAPEPRGQEIEQHNGFSGLSPAAQRRMRALEARRAIRETVQD